MFAFRIAQAAGFVAAVRKVLEPPGIVSPPAAGLPDGVSVVVPSRNGRELLARLLPQVVEQLDRQSSEIIVVDNGSDDGTDQFLCSCFAGVHVEHSEAALSFARAVNRGIARVRFSHVCLLNNDMLIEPGFFAALREAFRRVPDLFCATAQIFFPEGQRREETGKAVMPSSRNPRDFPISCELPFEGEDLSYVLYGSGGCSLYETSRLRALGGAGEVFEPAYVEDLDLGFRAWQRGWPTVFVAGARVVHAHRATTSRYYSEAELEQVLELNYLRFLARAVTYPPLFRALWREAMERLRLLSMENPGLTEVLAAARNALRWVERQNRAPDALPEDWILAIGSGDVAVFPGRPARGKPVTLILSSQSPNPAAHGSAARLYDWILSGCADSDFVVVHLTDQWRPIPAELAHVATEIVLVRHPGAAFHAAVRQSVRKWRPEIVRVESLEMERYAADCMNARIVFPNEETAPDQSLRATTE